MHVSVIICTHNPRKSNLEATLAALRLQQTSELIWELLVIDNCSNSPVKPWLDLEDLPNPRVLVEEELGLTPARARGMKEANGDIMLFVDDDNVLDPDYLQNVVNIGGQWPMLGAWGCGNLRGVFESPPPHWMEPYLWYITVHKVTRDCWTNQPDLNCFPPGAGLAVRREAARNYFDLVAKDPLRRSLDRKGANLASCGDMDLLWTLTEDGWGVGRFVSLALDHLIPSQRIEESYFHRLVANQWCSNVLLKYLHGVREVTRKPSLTKTISMWRYKNSLDFRTRWIKDAEMKGRQYATQMIDSIEAGHTNVRQSLE